MSTTIETPVQEATDTKERLIEAGMYEFAERGFKDASIRRICTRAGANAAAVNYHFGGKQRFYAEVLVTCHQRASSRPMPQLMDDPENPEEVLATWVHWFLDRLLVRSRATPLAKLMAREMFEPTPAIDDVILRSFMPIMGGLTQIVAALIGERAGPRAVQLTAQSVLGQCLMYKHVEPALERLHDLARRGEVPGHFGLNNDLAHDVDKLARHITEFSLAGMGVTPRAAELERNK